MTQTEKKRRAADFARKIAEMKALGPGVKKALDLAGATIRPFKVISREGNIILP